jgi:hypothetical protein
MSVFWDNIQDGYEFLDDARAPDDIVVLDGVIAPGIAEVRCEARQKLDIAKATGRDGGTIIKRGFEPARITITLTVVTPKHLTDLEALLDRLWHQPGKPSRQDRPVFGEVGKALLTGAISIEHPRLTKGVTHMVIESITGLEKGAQVGTRQMRIQGIQYIEPKPADATRQVKGEGPKLNAAFEPAKNEALQRQKPSKTQGGPKAPPAPTQGDY